MQSYMTFLMTLKKIQNNFVCIAYSHVWATIACQVKVPCVVGCSLVFCVCHVSFEINRISIWHKPKSTKSVRIVQCGCGWALVQLSPPGLSTEIVVVLMLHLISIGIKKKVIILCHHVCCGLFNDKYMSITMEQVLVIHCFCDFCVLLDILSKNGHPAIKCCWHAVNIMNKNNSQSYGVIWITCGWICEHGRYSPVVCSVSCSVRRISMSADLYVFTRIVQLKADLNRIWSSRKIDIWKEDKWIVW